MNAVTLTYGADSTVYANLPLAKGELQILRDLINHAPDTPKILSRKITLALQLTAAAYEADPTLGEQPGEEWPRPEDLEL